LCCVHVEIEASYECFANGCFERHFAAHNQLHLLENQSAAGHRLSSGFTFRQFGSRGRAKATSELDESGESALPARAANILSSASTNAGGFVFTEIVPDVQKKTLQAIIRPKGVA